MKDKLIQNRYLVLKTLASNSFSKTLLVRRKDLLSRRRYIVKQFRADKIDRTFYQSASIFKRLSGSDRQIPQLYEYFTVEGNFYIVREWIDGLTLKQKVEQQGKLSTAEVEQILKSLLSCLNYIHGYGIFYGQLKPNNIVLRHTYNIPIKRSLIDYLPVPLYFEGVGELTKESDRHDLVVTERRGYTFREQDKLVYANDIYNLGLTAIYLLTGKNPADLPVDPQTKQILWHQEVSQPNLHLIRTLDRAICPNPQDRFTSAKAMLQALNSPANISIPLSRVSSKNAGSEVKIAAILSGIGLGVFGVALKILDPQFAPFSQAEVEKLKYPIAEIEIEAITPSSSSNSTFDIEQRTPFSIPVFTVGVPQQQAIAYLGQPSRQGKGYWQNSRAFLYRDFIPGGVDLGYLADTKTNIIRQSEMSFAPRIDVQTIQHSAKLLLADNYSLDIARQIDLVYSARSDRQEFEVNDIKGVVQRNPRNYIYFAIWDSQFH